MAACTNVGLSISSAFRAFPATCARTAMAQRRRKPASAADPPEAGSRLASLTVMASVWFKPRLSQVGASQTWVDRIDREPDQELGDLSWQ